MKRFFFLSLTVPLLDALPVPFKIHSRLFLVPHEGLLVSSEALLVPSEALLVTPVTPTIVNEFCSIWGPPRPV